MGSKRTRPAVFAFGLAVAFAAGCGNDPSGPAPNQAPITEITGGPLEGGDAPSHVKFFVLGRDYDGTVPGQFDYILDTQRRSVASLDQVVRHPPTVNDSRWQRATSTQIALVAFADTLRADRRGDIGDGVFDRWHTFYVRAVDNEGAVDESPEVRTFRAVTQAPVIRVTNPARAGQTVTLPRTFVMNWDGFDPIGIGEPFQPPQAARWVILPATLDGNGNPIGFPEALYALPDTTWSDWYAWVTADSSGREKPFVDKVPPGGAARAFVFAVQGRDDAGAVTPQFDAATSSRNNYATIRVDGTLPVGPVIVVHADEDTLSQWTFNGVGAPAINVQTPEDTLTLNWDAPQTSHYGARSNPNHSRYGWNIVDPNNDEEWTPWSAARFLAPHAIPSAVQQNFYIQSRDQLGQITTGVIHFQRVVEAAKRSRS